MITIHNKAECCGCFACGSVCPEKCIEMKRDKEGFLYPVVDEPVCVQCGACDAVCPITNPVLEKECLQEAYLVQNKDEKVRRQSTSGGAFTAIASLVVEKGGVVFGAAYDKKFQVRHTYVEQIGELRIFRNSKYVQSTIGKTFEQVRKFLSEDRWVCFSGTPCQVEGLCRYLGKRYDKLVLVDVVCRAVPSPLVWEKYLEYQADRTQGADNILFREKHYGYKYSTMTFKQGDTSLYFSGVESDPMLRAFFSDICDRPSCHECRFKKRYRVSDFTIWDCFSVYDFNRKMDDDKGTTRLLIQSKKGMELFEEIKPLVHYYKVTPEKLIAGVKELSESVSMNANREEFFCDINQLNAEEFFGKWFPDHLLTKCKRNFRLFLIKTNLYSFAKRAKGKLRM